MKHIIFIRSYAKDLPWLKFCLRSIAKFVRGHEKVVVVVPNGDLKLFLDAGIEAIGTAESMAGYLQQQVDKIYAYAYCGGGDPWITFFDSDCVAIAPFDLAALFAPDGRPYLLRTPYASLGNKVPWQPITEAALGFPCPEETMRCHPMTYRASELRAFVEWFRKNRSQSIDQYVSSVKANNFSEFNALGSWLLRFHEGSRVWINTENDKVPSWPLRQFWSWGGVTPNIEQEIEKILA